MLKLLKDLQIHQMRPARNMTAAGGPQLFFYRMESLERRMLLSGYAVVASFTGANGAEPYSPLIMDGSGNIYGTTSAGGANGDGEIFEIAKGTSTITVLHSFDGTDGQTPDDGLLIDSSGNLYGTTFMGGTDNIGTIFEYSTTSSTFTSLYSFVTPTDGSSAEPYGGLIMDSNGDLFGTAKNGGVDGHGSIFELAKSGSGYSATDELLYSFTGNNDGKNPYGGVVMDGSGDLFGTTRAGGADGDGVIFELAAGATATTTLYTFTGGIDGREPDSGLIIESNGDLIGTAQQGGATARGDLYELTKSGSSYSTTLTTLYSFSSNTDGQYPWGAPIIDSKGDIFGTVEASGADAEGGIWELPAGATTTTDLHEFTGTSGDGANSYAALFMDPQGDLWGTTEAGGSSGDGTVFEITSSTQLAFAAEPGNTSAGTLPTINIDVEDQYGNIITTDTSNVTLSVHSGPGSLTGTVTVAAVDGVATFSNAALNTAGTYTLTASDGSDTPATSTSFSVSQAPATQLAFAVEPSNAAAGAANSPSIVVDVENQFGGIVTNDNSSVTLSVASGPGSLSGTVTVSASSGVATFSNIKLDTDGNYTLTASDGSLTHATSTSFAISSASATLLAFEQEPSTVAVGASISPAVTVEVEDQFGNLVTSGSSDVVISKASGPGSLSGTLSAFTSAGVATFGNLSVTAAGAYTLTASDGSLTHATSSSFTADATGSAKLAFVQQPTSVFAGGTESPAITVDVEDASGNLVTSDSSNVTLSVATGPGSLTGTVTVAASGGVATFSNIEIDASGSYTLTASDGSLTSATSSSFTVSPTAAAKLAFTQQPTAALINATITPAVTVHVEDQFGNVETTNSSNVTLSVASGPGTLGGTLTVAAVNGVATFSNLSLNTAGSYTLTASDGSLTSATSNSFTISNDVATKLAYAVQPSSTVVGTTISPAVVVHVEDVSGNVVTTDNSNVTLSVASGPGTLSGTVTEQAVNGVATFNNLSLSAVGTYTLTASDGSLTHATSSSFAVTTDGAAKLAFEQQPTSITAGGTISPAVTVEVENGAGGLVTLDNSNVTLAIASGPGSLGGTLTVQAVNGVATFSNLSLTAAGTYTLTASDGSLTHATSTTFTVSPTAATKLAFSQQPTDAGLNSTITPAVTVAIEDQYGNVVTSNSSNVTLSLASGPGTLSGTLTVAASGGIATFSTLSVNTEGTYTLHATDGSLTSATSNSFVGTTVSNLVIVNPQATSPNFAIGAIDLTVATKNQDGDLVTDGDATMTAKLYSQATGDTVTQTLTAPVNEGYAQFHLSLPSKSGAYTLSLVDGAITVSSAASFSVTDIPLKWQWYGGSDSILWSANTQAEPSETPAFVAAPVASTPAPSTVDSPPAFVASTSNSGTSESQAIFGAGNDNDLLATPNSLFGVPLSRRMLE